MTGTPDADGQSPDEDNTEAQAGDGENSEAPETHVQASDEEPATKPERSRPRGRNPYSINLGLDLDLVSVRRQQDELFRSITKPYLSPLRFNTGVDTLREIRRKQYEELTKPLRDAVRVHIPKINTTGFTRSYFDGLTASAHRQRDITHELAQRAESEGVGQETREAIQAYEAGAEATLEEVEELGRDLKFDDNGSPQNLSEENLERVQSTVESVAVGHESTLVLQRLADSFDARRAEAKDQNREANAQHQASQRIAILASVVAILALVGSVPQGIAAIPDVARLLPGWGLPWWGNALCVLVSVLVIWALLAAWNSRHEEDAGPFLSRAVKAGTWVFGKVGALLRWGRILPRKRADGGA